MNDYNLVKLIKEEQTATKKVSAIYELFSRNKKMIQKLYSQSLLRKLGTIPFEDFEQEAFILSLKAIDYIKLHRIVDQENWRFGWIFYHFLKRYLYQTTKKELRMPIDYKETMDENVDDYRSISTHMHTEVSIEKILITQFKDHLSPIELTYFNLRLPSNGDSKVTFEDIGKTMGITKQYVSLINKKVQGKWKKFIKEKTPEEVFQGLIKGEKRKRILN